MRTARNYKSKRPGRASSWKKLKLYTQLKRKLKLFALSLIVVISTIVVIGAVNVYRFLATPLAQASGATDEGAAWESGRFNLLVVVLEKAADDSAAIRKITVLSLDSAASRYFSLRVSPEIDVFVSRDFGGQKLRSVYSLGALKKPKANLDLTAKVVSRLLAVPIDGYILTDDEGLGELGKTLVTRRQLKTNLSWRELLEAGFFLWRSKIDRGQLDEATPEFFADPQSADVLLSDFFRDSQVADESLNIQVLNGTERTGLANVGARFAANMGANVIDVGNFSPEEGGEVRNSFMVTANPGSFTARRLAKALRISDVREPFGSLGERADITVVLGLDTYFNL